GVHDRRAALGDVSCEVDHLRAVVDPDGAAARVERPPEEDTAPAADVEQRIVGRQLQCLEDGLPRPGVDVIRAVRLARLAAVRPASAGVGHAFDPPLADPAHCYPSRMKPWRAALTSATASGKSTRIASRNATACWSLEPSGLICDSAAPVSSTAVFRV